MIAPVGFSFSVAGLLFPFHAGVIDTLAPSVLSPAAPINGASGGALAAACAAANFPSAKSIGASLRVASSCTQEGAFLNLEKILRTELSLLCDEEMLAEVNGRPVSPFTVVEGVGLGVDGFLSTPSTLGCQPTSASTTVNITPFAVLGKPSQNVIAPTLDEVPFSPQLYVSLALGRPGPDEGQHQILFELGKRCASRWLEQAPDDPTRPSLPAQ